MNDMTDRQRQVEAMANAQIPGLPADEKAATAPVSASVSAPEVDDRNIVASTQRDVIDLSGAPVEPPTEPEIEQITTDVIGQLKSVYDPEIPVGLRSRRGCSPRRGCHDL